LPVTFTKTLRALRSDNIPWNWSVLAVLGLFPLVIAWLFLAHISVYEVSTSAWIEVLSVPQSLTTEIEGRVLSSYLRLGQDVEVKDILVTLDDQSVRRQLDEPQQIIKTANNRLAKLNEEFHAKQATIAALEKVIKLASEQAQAQLEVAETQFKRANQRLAQAKTLSANNTLAKEDFEDRRAEAETAATLARAARLAIDQGEQERLAEKLQCQAELAEVKGEQERLEGEIGTQEVRLRELRKIRSPVTGSIEEVVPFRVGAVVKPGEKLATIVPPGPTRLVAQVPVIAVGRVVPGNKARLRLDGYPWTQYGTISAKVTGVGTEPSQGSIRVELEITDQNSSIPLQHGQSGIVEIEVDRVSPAILVLRAAGQQLMTRRSAVSK
jgi:multidrug resistance efflux pump